MNEGVAGNHSNVTYADPTTFLLDHHVDGVPIESADAENPQIASARLKLAIDLACSSLLLFILSPVLLLVAFVVACDGGPVIFSHRRVGRCGRTFECLKFRTMVTNSDEVLLQLLRTDRVAAKEWSETRKLRKDPRITRVGLILRKTSLDELPQLINIIRGDMSLVGPRPIVKQEVVLYADRISSYYSVRPGLTGLWQISGRSDTSFDQRVDFDVQYVRSRSTKNDLKILFRTLPSVLGRKGAF